MADEKTAADLAREAAEKLPDDATQKEIADEAGVSTSTVSRALKDEDGAEAPTADDVRPLNDAGSSGHASPGKPEVAVPVGNAPAATAPVSDQAEPVGNAGNPVSRRDVDAVAGHFVDVVKGEHQGRFGQYVETVDRNKDGVPTTILVRSRDARNELLEVKYSEVRPSERAGGR